MKYLTHILLFLIVASLSACGGGGSEPDLSAVQDIVIVGGDTLGRNWDNLPTKEEAAEAEALGLTPEQYVQIKEELKQKELEERLAQQNELGNESFLGESGENTNEIKYEPTSFSKKMYQEKTYTIESVDGREVVVGSGENYK